MLAYNSGVPTAYDPALTSASFFIAFVIATLGFFIGAQGDRWWAIASGALIGAGIGAMHFTGMAALIVGGTLRWDLTYVTASMVVGIALTSAAMLAFASLARRPYGPRPAC